MRLWPDVGKGGAFGSASPTDSSTNHPFSIPCVLPSLRTTSLHKRAGTLCPKRILSHHEGKPDADHTSSWGHIPRTKGETGRLVLRQGLGGTATLPHPPGTQPVSARRGRKAGSRRALAALGGDHSSSRERTHNSSFQGSNTETHSSKQHTPHRHHHHLHDTPWSSRTNHPSQELYVGLAPGQRAPRRCGKKQTKMCVFYTDSPRKGWAFRYKAWG